MPNPLTPTFWTHLRDKALENQPLTNEEALRVLHCADSEFLAVVDAARAVRETNFGKRVKLNYLVNVKSGICPEDCHYCSQSKDSQAPIPKYPLMTAPKPYFLIASWDFSTTAG